MAPNSRRGVHVPQPIPGSLTDPAGFPVLVEDFLTDLGARGYSPETILSRRQSLAQFAAWAGDRGVTRPAEVTRPVLVRYQRHLFHYRKADGHPLSFRSQNSRLLPLRAFFTWAVKNGHVAANPASDLDLPKVEHRLPKAALTAAEAEQVLATPDTSTIVGLRDRVMLEVLYCTGIRRAELAHLNVRDLDLERLTLMVRAGKGKKDRMVPLHARAATWLTHYLTGARPRLVMEPDDGTVFLTVDGTPFSLDRLTQLARDHVIASGVAKDGACHLFRHTLATVMLEGGADIRYVQAMLGHAELSTTQIYAHVSIRALQAVHHATHPAASDPRTRRVPSDDARGDDGHRDGGRRDDLSPLKVSAFQLLSSLEQEDQLENRVSETGEPS
jgi:integrase/recombinase XerD